MTYNYFSCDGNCSDEPYVVPQVYCDQGDHYVGEDDMIKGIPFIGVCKWCVKEYLKSILEEESVEELENFNELVRTGKIKLT